MDENVIREVEDTSEWRRGDLPPFGGATCRKCGVDHGHVSGEFDGEDYGGDGTGLQVTYCKGGPSWFGCKVTGEHLHRWCPTCQAAYLERVREGGDTPAARSDGICLDPCGRRVQTNDREPLPAQKGDPFLRNLMVMMAVFLFGGMAYRLLLAWVLTR